MYRISYPSLIFLFITLFNTSFYQIAQGDNTGDKTFACPGSVTPVFSDEQVCNGSLIKVPTMLILANIDNPESAIIVWDSDVTAPVFNLNATCTPVVFEFNYTVLCSEDPSFSITGGTHTVSVFPQVQAPTINIDADCNHEIIPFCSTDVIEPSVVDPSLPSQQFTVTNPIGCTSVFTVPIPTCFPPIVISDVTVIPNCNQYAVSFNIDGGSGNYFVNGIALSSGQTNFISPLILCGTPYNFQVTDHLMLDIQTVSGTGPNCFAPLGTSTPFINVIGIQYQVLFIITGGTGDYTVDGIPLASNLFTSDLIDCGQPFVFSVTDGCGALTVADLPECFDPITVTEPIIEQDCDEFQTTINISGGTGNYIVNGTPLVPGQNTVISTGLNCGANFFYQVTDDLGTDMVDVAGTGPTCYAPFLSTDPIVDITNLEYEVSFSLSGGTGSYTVNGTPIPGSNFVSTSLPCGTPYSFEVSDGCETFIIEDSAFECYLPITAETQVSFECSEYQVALILSGGTGNYVVNNTPLAAGQTEFTSLPMTCGNSYNFQVTDDIGSGMIEIAGSSPDCPQQLTVSPVTIERELNQYRVSFTLSNGTGNYIINGVPFDGNEFVSELINCGQLYFFSISDSCHEIVLNEMLPDCIPPITSTDLEIIPNCDQYRVQFSLSGGSGPYLVNGTPITGNVYVSPLLDCSTDYNFEVTDSLNFSILTLSGEGMLCNDPLSTSNIAIANAGSQYSVEFNIFGGTGNYLINGLVINGDQFISSPINCGMPYEFILTDNCDTLTISGDSPCEPNFGTSAIEFEQMCHQYIGQFTIIGGSGDYSVNGNPITGDSVTTELLDCGTLYTFEIMDNQSAEVFMLEGTTPDCIPMLDASDVLIEINENQFVLQITPTGGFGNYTINGDTLVGSTFTSDTIECGAIYSFEVSDGCQIIDVMGGPTTCEPLSITQVLFDMECNQYFAQFSISGGSGVYSVNGTSVGGSIFVSEPIDCGTPYNFDILDDQILTTFSIIGDGPECIATLDTSNVEIVTDNFQFQVMFTASGGSGNYSVNGEAFSGNTFSSNLINCGEPYNLELSDGCEVISIAGGPVDCFLPLSVSDVVSNQLCEQFTAEFTINGGSGNYSVNGNPVTDTSFVSALFDCGTTVTLEVSDDQTMESLLLVVNGPTCPEDLTAEEVDASIFERDYTILFNLDGGSGEYFIDSTLLLGNLFISDTIPCGTPYSFIFTDGCDTLLVEGAAPCDLCADFVGDFSLQIDQCHGELPGLPSDNEILESLNIPDFATVSWSDAIDIPLENTGENCELVTETFSLTIGCSLDSTVNLTGGEVIIAVHPEPQAPTIVLTDSTAMNCICQVIPACEEEMVEPAIIEIPNGTTDATFDVMVFNQGCSEGISYSVPVPDCILVSSNEPEQSLFDLKIHHNPFGKGEKLGIQFTLPSNQELVIQIYDLNGKKLDTLKNQRFESGTHYVEWDGTNQNGQHVSAGMYIIELQTPNGRHLKKVMKYN